MNSRRIIFIFIVLNAFYYINSKYLFMWYFIILYIFLMFFFVFLFGKYRLLCETDVWAKTPPETPWPFYLMAFFIVRKRQVPGRGRKSKLFDAKIRTYDGRTRLFIETTALTLITNTQMGHRLRIFVYDNMHRPHYNRTFTQVCADFFRRSGLGNGRRNRNYSNGKKWPHICFHNAVRLWQFLPFPLEIIFVRSW